MYAVSYVYGMWRVMMLDERYLPSTNEDKESRIETYCILKGLMEAVGNEANGIRKMLNNKAYGVENTRSCSRKREKEENVFVIDSPKKKVEVFSP